MKLTLQLYFIFLICFTYASENNKVLMKDVNSSDADIKLIFTEYQKALAVADIAFPSKWFISDKEFREILNYVVQNQPNCIGTEESAFTAELNEKLYTNLITSKLVINEISVKKIEHNYSCGNLLEIPRVICDVKYAGKKVIEVPFLLIKTMKGDYKILRNFLSYRIFSND